MKRISEDVRKQVLEGSLIRAMLVIAVPVVINSMIQTCYNLTDTYWLGRVGTDALAAINLVTPVQNIVINFGSGISVAGSVLISQYLGAGKKEEANRMANQVFSCALLFSCVCAGLICLITPVLVRWLGADGGVLDAGISYLRLVILDMPCLFTVNVFQAVSQSRGNTVRPMLVNLLGVLINMALDPLLMAVLNMGAAGAALATVGAKAAAASVALAALVSRKGELHLKGGELRPQKEYLHQIVHIGLPTAMGSSMMQVGFLLMSRTVLTYGSQAMAAYGIGNKINGLISMPSNAMGSATATITALNIGAGKPDRAQQGCRLSILCSVAFLFACGLLISRPAVSRGLVSIFSSDEEVIALAADFLALMAFWAWSNGFYNSLTGLFQGTGHTEVTMVSDASRLWIYRFATLWFCERVLHLGVRSVWLSVVISNGIAALVLYILYRRGIWRRNRVGSGKTGTNRRAGRMDRIEAYILRLVEKSTPEKTAWNMEKIREGKPATWNYIDGCMLTALLSLTEITRDNRYAAFAEQVTDHFVREDGSILTFDEEKRQLDDINEGRVLFPVYRMTGKEKYRKAAVMLHRALSTQPRTVEGSFWHKKIYPDQVWLDGVYMAQPFEALYQETFGNGDVSDILKQVRTVQEKMRDPGTGLYYHGYDASRKAFWADPETGLSRCVWLRALGWFFMALADVSEILPDGAERDEIAGIFRSLAESVARYADPETGLYWQVVDQGSREGNYLESSGSSMMACGMLKGARLGILEERFAALGRKTFGTLTDRLIWKDGEPELGGICLVAGLGPENNRRRDGSFEYYVSEPVVSNDAKGVAPFVLCYTEMLRAGS